jgi:L-ascorbate 6-phosphate lactonase
MVKSSVRDKLKPWGLTSTNDLAGSPLSEIEDTPAEPALKVWALSGAGFVMRVEDDIIYIDPWLVPPDSSRKTHRAYPPPFPPGAVKKALAVLSTHEHEDHCNAETLLGINSSTGALLLGPKSSTKKALAAGYPASRAVSLSPGDAYKISPSFNLTAFGASDPYEDSALMYLLETPRGNVFHSGDTSYFEGFKDVGDRYAVDIALLNFGKQIPTPEKPYYMNADKVARAARDLKARTVVPMHWNLWIETLEDPSPIEGILNVTSPSSRLVILEGGQKLEL